MSFKDKITRKDRLFFFIIIINIILLALDFILDIFPIAIKTNNLTIIQYLKLPLLIIILILSVVILILYRFSIYKPVNELEIFQKSLVTKDIKSLSIAISELASGNLTAQASVQSKKFKDSNSGIVSGLADSYNQILSEIQESAQDFNTVTAVACKRICYVGADSFREGKKCGEIMGELLQGKGQVAILLRSFSITGANLRRKGFQNTISEKYPGIQIVEILEEQEDIDTTYRLTVELLKKWSNLSAIYICEGTTPTGASRAVDEAGKTGVIKIVTHDLADLTMKAMSEGSITATLSQNAYAQGYDPVIHLYNYLINRNKPVINRMLTNMGVITKENYHEYWNPEKGSILSETDKKALVLPLKNTTGKTLKIAVILPDDKVFWKSVSEGARDAVNTLNNYNAEVKYLVPESFFINKDWGANASIPVIESLINEGYKAIAIPIFDRNLVPYLNKIIESGIAIATFNSEPLSFRGMVGAVVDHARNLFKFSENLASGSNETSQAAAQISKTMKFILNGTKDQLEKLSDTEKILDSLRSNISQVILETPKSAGAAEEAIRTAQTGQAIVSQNSDAMISLQMSSNATTKIIKTLNEDTIKIKDIVSIIEDIASQTNVLAINASIQAAHAGSEGKGFSVVALEIRKLAEESSRATGNIRKLIETILKGVAEATKSIMDSINEVNKSAEMAEKAKTALNDIMKASRENEDKINEIDKSVKEMQILSENVLKSMQSLASVNHENATAIESITSSTEEMKQEVSEINEMANVLADMSQSQEDLISQFNL